METDGQTYDEANIRFSQFCRTRLRTVQSNVHCARVIEMWKNMNSQTIEVRNYKNVLWSMAVVKYVMLRVG